MLAATGNNCEGGKRGRKPGHGRVVVSKFNGKSGEECGWDVVKVINIPRTAYFMDYSGMAFRGEKVGTGVGAGCWVQLVLILKLVCKLTQRCKPIVIWS